MEIKIMSLVFLFGFVMSTYGTSLCCGQCDYFVDHQMSRMGILIVCESNLHITCNEDIVEGSLRLSDMILLPLFRWCRRLLIGN